MKDKDRMHGSARAMRCNDGCGWTPGPGRAPDWIKPRQQMIKNVMCGSAPVEPWPGWDKDSRNEKIKNSKPHSESAEPSEGWPRWREQLDAELDASAQAMIWKPGLPTTAANPTYLPLFAHAWMTDPHACARECVGRNAFLAFLASGEHERSSEGSAGQDDWMAVRGRKLTLAPSWLAWQGYEEWFLRYLLGMRCVGAPYGRNVGAGNGPSGIGNGIVSQ